MVHTFDFFSEVCYHGVHIWLSFFVSEAPYMVYHGVYIWLTFCFRSTISGVS